MSRPRADGLEEYRVRQEREDARLHAVFADRGFMEAARHGIERWQAGDRTGVVTLEQFAEKYNLPRP